MEMPQLLADLSPGTRDLGDSPMSLFGIEMQPNMRASLTALCEALADCWVDDFETRLGKILRRYELDISIAELSGRWNPEPKRFVPGDVLPLRGYCCQSAIDTITQVFSRSHESTILGTGASPCIIQSAMPYFIPSISLNKILEAPAPADEVVEMVRLRSPASLVIFEEELPFPQDELSIVVEHTKNELEKVRSYFGQEEREGIVEAVARLGGKLTGCVILSDRSGRLRDEIIWLVSADEPPNTWRSLVWGFQSISALGSLSRMLAATLAWGTWHKPVEKLDTSNLKRLAKTGAWKRREPKGALGGVRVLDVRQTTPGESEKGILERLSPVPHWRRPHTKLVRVGPKTEWHYESRDIARSLVLPHGPVRCGEVVWRIPTIG